MKGVSGKGLRKVGQEGSPEAVEERTLRLSWGHSIYKRGDSKCKGPEVLNILILR